jgi:hypothetical protein
MSASVILNNIHESASLSVYLLCPRVEERVEDCLAIASPINPAFLLIALFNLVFELPPRATALAAAARGQRVLLIKSLDVGVKLLKDAVLLSSTYCSELSLDADNALIPSVITIYYSP